MFVLRQFVLALPAAAGLLAIARPALAEPARERTLFTWSGTIDREVTLVIRGRSVETHAGGLDASFPARVEQRDDLPRDVGAVQVHLADGRGIAEVVQQPTARNDYTALVRILDPKAGADRYRVVASWQPIVIDRDDRARDDRDRDRRDPNGDYDRDRDRDRDDAWDRNRGGYDRSRGRDAGVLSWRGDVDDVAEIRIQGRRVEFRNRSGQFVRDVRYDVRGANLPRRPVSLELDVQRGRGSVEVVQEPSPFNGFTAVIRVVDRRAGSGIYDFDLRWY